MNHPTNDELLLAAYGEAPEHEAHLRQCGLCRSVLQQLEEGRLILEMGSAARITDTRPVWATAAVAAGLVGMMMLASREPGPARESRRDPVLSLTPSGYVASPEMMELDAQLIRLERGMNEDNLGQ